MRASGVLLPVSSIPSRYGIGAFSKEAYTFIDFLKEAGQTYWQILPLGPTGYGDSPYQSFSTFAGNPYFIDLEQLVADGYLQEEELKELDFGTSPEYVDYEKIYHQRFPILKKAFERFQKLAEPSEKALFQAFIEENADWLSDYALYMAIKDSLHGISYLEWPEEIKLRRREALSIYQKQLQNEVLYYEFQQYLFTSQWKRLKTYANQKGIQIIGDIPIYVALDSADTWSHPELFQFDEQFNPVAVAGCPPDAFSVTGQLWGNPLYRWSYHQEQGYAWWLKRLSHCFELYDTVRIDHFRGFDEYYAIPYGDPTAEFGHWEKGPGYELFDVMKRTLGKRSVIAEDLGFLTPSVIKMVKKTGFPGMKVLQFAFDADGDSEYLPHHYTANTVVYTGTHDNDTTLAWYQSLSRKDRSFAKKYLNIKGTRELPWYFIRSALSSVADTAIIPMQDYLGLSGEARMNMPSTLGNNWKWRMKQDALSKELAASMYELARLYGRVRA